MKYIYIYIHTYIYIYIGGVAIKTIKINKLKRSGQAMFMSGREQLVYFSLRN
jgi:hypothetical protein